MGVDWVVDVIADIDPAGDLLWDWFAIVFVKLGAPVDVCADRYGRSELGRVEMIDLRVVVADRFVYVPGGRKGTASGGYVYIHGALRGSGPYAERVGVLGILVGECSTFCEG